ncbi:VOC family protein [Streptomyces sp. NPDC006711]|uniref:VOC family protein n=1 Tax=Streptomyces sp. NPDC006711 TaxID=3364762 RepID=UPI0036BB596D
MPVRTTYAAGDPCWIDRISARPEAAEAFYAALFGWTYAEEGGYRTARLAGELVAGFGSAPGPLESWTVYLAAKDVDATAAVIAELGGRVVLGPVDAGPNGRLLLATDPAGTLTGCWQGARARGVVLADEAGAACGYELRVPDPSAVAGFYRGLGAHPTAGDGPGGSFRIVQDRSAPPHWLVYFGVDSPVASAGAALLAGARPVGPAAGGRVVLRDAGGARFGLSAAAPRPAGPDTYAGPPRNIRIPAKN